MEKSDKFPEIRKIFVLIGLILLLFHFIFVFVIPVRTWGFDFIKYYSPSTIIMFYLFGVSIVIFPLSVYFNLHKTESLFNRLDKYYNQYKRFLSIIFLELCLILFWFFKVKYPLLGDGLYSLHYVVNESSRFDWGLGIYYYIYRIIQIFTSISGQQVYVITHVLLGPVFLIISFQIAKNIGRIVVEKIFVFGCLTASGIILIFFGYVEVYGFAVIFLMIYFYCGILFLKNRCSLTVVLIFLMISIIMHRLNIIFFPSFLFLIFRKYDLLHKIKQTYIFTILMFILLLIILFYKKLPLLQFLPKENQPYYLLSFKHLIEFLNSQILTAPVCFLLGCILFIFCVLKKIKINEISLFSGIAGIFGLLFAITANFKLGSLDWDVMAFSGIPVTIFATSLAIQMSSHFISKQNLFYVIVIVTGFSFLNTIPWITLNSSDKSVKRYVEIVLTEPANRFVDKNGSGIAYKYYELYRLGFKKEAFELMKYDLKVHPNQTRGYYNVAVQQIINKEYEEAEKNLNVLVNRFPNYIPTYVQLSELALLKNDTTSFIESVNKLINFSKNKEAYSHIIKLGAEKRFFNYQLLLEQIIKKREGKIK
ncbi:tetratricopeptide repeat protein [candidate division KSB1 bacterium]